jgi:HlyD family secretion protein
MAIPGKAKKKSVKKILIPIMIVVLLAGAGVVYYFWKQAQTFSAQTTEPEYNTATVRTGTLEISADGSGSLTPGQEVSLSFPVAGKLKAVNVAVGDLVEEGQVLAELADTTSLQTSITEAELTLKLAQKSLDNLTTNAASNLATARQTFADAEQAYYDALYSVVDKSDKRCEDQTIETYYDEWLAAQTHYNSVVAEGSESDNRYYTYTIVPAKETMDKAYAAYTTCLGYTDYEIQTSHDDLTIAQSTMEAARNSLDALTANNGIDPTDQIEAQLAVARAELALQEAKDNLAGAVMTAPFTGTVLTVNGSTGETVDTGAFITIIDLAHPKVDFSADETDLALINVGEATEVTFDALPDLLFRGTVISLNPSLYSTGGYQVLSGVIQLELDDTNQDARLLDGLNASVLIINGRAENVLLVPVEALVDLGDGSYGVMVVGMDGKPRLSVVEIGLMDETYVEIKSGVKQGDVVTTGAVETN